jgi:hypothetical protein
MPLCVNSSVVYFPFKFQQFMLLKTEIEDGSEYGSYGAEMVLLYRNFA